MDMASMAKKYWLPKIRWSLGLSIPSKVLFENFIDKCVLTSVDSAIFLKISSSAPI